MPSAIRVGVLLLAVNAAAQNDPGLTLRVTVTLVQVDAVVTDSKGRHVPGLGPADFEIRQDGELQKITHVTYVTEPPPARPLPAGADPEPIGPPAPIARQQVTRIVALVVDDLSLSFASLVRVREALRKYVQQQMQPGDLVALVRTGGGVAILEQFTGDPRILMAGVDLLKWRFSGRTGLLPIHSDPDSGPRARPDAPQILDYGVTLAALGSLGTMEQVIQGMRGLPGRKSIVLFSDALGLDARVSDALDRLTDLANRSAVSIYSIDPRGLRTGSPLASGDSAPADDLPGALMPGMTETRGTSQFSTQEGLASLSHRTGGLFFSNNNDIAGAIRQAADDQMGYYLLAYTPREGTFEKNLAKAKFHRISVQVKRPGLHVRWKSGFTGVPDDVAASEVSTAAPRTREQQLLEALASPFRATGLTVRLASFYTDTGATGPYVSSFLQFDSKGLSFTHQPDGTWHARVDVVTSAFRDIKQPIQQRQRSQEIVLPEDQYRIALREGFVYRLSDPMKLPGAFLMRAVVRDAASEHIGSASEVVQVPDTRKGQLALSGIVINLASANQLEPGEPVDDLAPRDDSAEPWAEGGPAVRRYRPGQHIVYSFMVVNPKLTGTPPSSNLEYQVRLFRNGRVVFTGEPSPIQDTHRIDSRRVLVGGILHLKPQFPPGEYLLQVLATDKHAPRSRSRVAQWIDFEVVPFSS
ncbi:MAG: VWA domain-containing protein [Candidatus Sulfopaludibacter sp.]|nr:VWA domain-containing protein [Candidatus Sulfopaludibacter sp.]